MIETGTSDGPREACGVVGVITPQGTEAARSCFFALFTLQHRGQESAGLSVGDGQVLRTHKRMGLITQIFTEEIIAGLPGYVAVGHTRYSTTGSSTVRNTQPIEGCFRGTPFVLAHNGNLINTVELRRELEAGGASFGTSMDSEVIARVIEQAEAPDFETACFQAVRKLNGAYSLVLASPTTLIALRDPWGIRPLCLGRFDEGGGFVVASETCALGPIGASFIREIEPGQAVVADRHGLREVRVEQYQRDAICLFEFIYFARPDSHMYGKCLWRCRQQMGHLLAQEHPVEADIVIPVPDTAFPAAIGYAQASRIPFTEGLIKNRYIQRTFIAPDPRMRVEGVKMKLAPLRENLRGMRVVVVDDSIVRGTTTVQQVKLLRDAGAAEVHLRISSPPVRYPCYYGIDMATQGELIAHRLSVPQIRDFLGADSLGYLSLTNTIKAIGLREPAKPKFCRACWDGEYPCPIPENVRVEKLALERRAPRPDLEYTAAEDAHG